MNKINLPNKITILRMIVVILMIGVALLPFDNGFKIGSLEYTYTNVGILLLFIIGSFSDYLDGHLARKNNLVTTFGKFMDPIADKLLVNTIFIILASSGIIHWLIAVIMIGRDIVVDGIRMVVVEQGKVIAASKLGKLKTVTQMVAIILLLAIPNVAWIQVFAVIAALCSLVSGLDYFFKNKNILLSDLRGNSSK